MMHFIKNIPFAFLVFACISLPAQSYTKMHRKAIVADLHNDVLSSVVANGLNVENDLSGKAHSDITRFKKGGVDVQIFSVWCDEKFGRDTAFTYANIEIDSLYSIAARNADKIMIVKTPGELATCVKQKKLAAMMGVEGGHMIEDNLLYLDSLFKRGARYMTLTWNNSTSWASSAADESNDSLTNLKKGLNDFGKQVVKHMNELGMMVDISHTGETTFWDVMNIVTKPVIASHSCVFTLCPVFRNLKDDQIKAIGKNGGVIFLNFYSGFLDSSFLGKQKIFFANHKPAIDSLTELKWEKQKISEWLVTTYHTEWDHLRPPFSLLIDHLDYMVKLIGADHVGLGSDFDGISSTPQQLHSVEDFPLITKELVARGYSKKDIRKILGENFLRVFKINMQH